MRPRAASETTDASRASGETAEVGAAGDGMRVEPVLTTAEKAAIGEAAGHNKMLEKGMQPVGETDGVYRGGETGIDGVYRHPNPPPDYVITEVKYDQSKLSTLADGTRQMSDQWVSERLAAKVGREEAERIAVALENSRVEKWMLKVKPDGSVAGSLIDGSGYVIRGNAGKVPGF